MNAAELKTKLKAVEESHEKASLVRAHRAISWLARAEAEKDDQDARFIFLWISFNAAYAQEMGIEAAERDKLMMFFGSLIAVDSGRRIHRVLFETFTGPIRTLIENRYVFEPFWRALREHDSSERWKVQFDASRKAALAAVVGGDTGRVLSVVFDRLYVLRNQLVHGGATWNSSVNRSQVKDGATIMMSIVPILIELLLDHPELPLSNINYPVVPS